MMPNYHESRTPQEHIDALKESVIKLCELDFVKSAHVDDWGKFSNFSIFATVKTKPNPKNRNLYRRSEVLMDSRSIIKIKKALMTDLSALFPDSKIRIENVSLRGAVYNLDVDFYKYDPENNIFPEKMPA